MTGCENIRGGYSMGSPFSTSPGTATSSGGTATPGEAGANIITLPDVDYPTLPAEELPPDGTPPNGFPQNGNGLMNTWNNLTTLQKLGIAIIAYKLFT